MTTLRRYWPVWFLIAFFALVHLGVAGRYDIFRNELYFIVCGRHPDFGYADQPPLVPLIAATTQLFGDSVWLLRLPAVLATVALIPLAARFARLMGAGDWGTWFSALAASIAPMLMGLSTVTTTETFKSLTWTAVAFLVTRALLEDRRRDMLWAGLVAGIALEAKYGMAIWLIGIALGLAATPARRIFAWKETWLGALIAAVVVAPSVVWQAVHGWPFLEVTAHHSARNLTGSPLIFLIGQVLTNNPALAPLWIAGIVVPFLVLRLHAFRFLGVSFMVAAVVVYASHGKDYYLAPAYPSLFALGAAAVGNPAAWMRRGWAGVAVLLSAIVAPVTLPLLDPPSLAAYLDHTHLRPRPDGQAGIGAPLTQIFSDELGWRSMEKQVAAAYNALGPEDKAKVAILTVDYGEAAAIDYYGAADGLPPALSGQNQYFLWGAHGHDGSVILAVNGRPERWAQICRSSEVVGQFGADFTMPYENNRPIMLCHGLKRDLTETWVRFKHLD